MENSEVASSSNSKRTLFITLGAIVIVAVIGLVIYLVINNGKISPASIVPPQESSVDLESSPF